jgi:hypothetical protein
MYNGQHPTRLRQNGGCIEANRFQKQPSLHSDGGLSQTEGPSLSPPPRPVLTAAMGLIVLQQFSGQPSIIAPRYF